MREKDIKNEGLSDMAFKVEKDHEVQMARAELYKIAKYAIKLHEILKGQSEEEGIDGWVASKITKAGDYMSSVYHHLDYEVKFEDVNENLDEKSKGLYYNVNKRKKAGTSRPKGHPDAPSDQDWKNAAKTAKESEYKHELQQMLEANLAKKQAKCPDCGNPSYKTLPEEKQKGVDGKVCWKGYKRMGTKKKGGKTVDNCVKM